MLTIYPKPSAKCYWTLSMFAAWWSNGLDLKDNPSLSCLSQVKLVRWTMTGLGRNRCWRNECNVTLWPRNKGVSSAILCSRPSQFSSSTESEGSNGNIFTTGERCVISINLSWSKTNHLYCLIINIVCIQNMFPYSTQPWLFQGYIYILNYYPCLN